jgi:hypothetical protein
MTLDYLPVLELAKTDLFARKFDDSVDSLIKDVIDEMRHSEEDEYRLEDGGGQELKAKKLDTSFEGHGILIVAKNTLWGDMNNDADGDGSSETGTTIRPLCMGLGSTRNIVKLVPCFHDDVPLTLAQGWETGAVIVEETLPQNRWQLGPCSTDGHLVRLQNGTMSMTPGKYIETGPRCHLTQMDGIRAGRCLDSESDRVQPTGGTVSVYPCRGRWHQFVSFGGVGESVDENESNDDFTTTATATSASTFTPLGSIHINIPQHISKRIKSRGRGDQSQYLCVGVQGRSLNEEEEEWLEDTKLNSETRESENDSDHSDQDNDPSDDNDSTNQKEEAPFKFDGFHVDGTLKSLSAWEGQPLVTTKCTNADAVIEWVVVPFIVEDVDQGHPGPMIVNEHDHEDNDEDDNDGELDEEEELQEDEL